MLPNEVFALACLARYEEMGLVVDKHNGEFAHCPLPKKMGDKGYYLLHDDHQHQGLLQSRDVGRVCFFTPYAKRWLENCDPFPVDYFGLWDIYEEFAGDNARKNNEKIHAEKDENGRSLHNMKLHAEKDERGKSLHSLKLHGEKDENGKSLLGKRLAAAVHAEKDENGRSLHSLKINAEKDENGKSITAVKGGLAAHAEKDENGRSLHSLKINAEKDENGKSITAVKGGLAAHAEKDENGKSLHSLKLHAEKDENGKSVLASKGGAATKLKTQKKVELTRISDGVIFVFDSLMDACRALALTPSALRRVCRGKLKQHKGYTARFL